MASTPSSPQPVPLPFPTPPHTAAHPSSLHPPPVSCQPVARTAPGESSKSDCLSWLPGTSSTGTMDMCYCNNFPPLGIDCQPSDQHVAVASSDTTAEATISTIPTPSSPQPHHLSSLPPFPSIITHPVARHSSLHLPTRSVEASPSRLQQFFGNLKGSFQRRVRARAPVPIKKTALQPVARSIQAALGEFRNVLHLLPVNTVGIS